MTPAAKILFALWLLRRVRRIAARRPERSWER